MSSRPDELETPREGGTVDPIEDPRTSSAPADGSPDPDPHTDDERPAALEDAAEPTPEDERVAELIQHTIDVPVLASAVEQQEAADAADTLETLDEASKAADALAEMETPLAVGIVEEIADDDPGQAARLLELMAPDDAADLLQALDHDRRERLLALFPVEEVAPLRRLIGYDKESAGGLMTTDFIALRGGMSVDEAIDVIRRRRMPDGMHHLPVVNGEGVLVGIVGLRELLINAATDPVSGIMNDTVRVVRVDMDREEVAREFDRYDYSMMAVVDDRDHLVGIVTVDDVIDIIRAEQTEDVQKMVGAGAEEAVYSPLSDKFRGRSPWLLLSLLLTCLAAAVIPFAAEMIERQPLLAFFLPVIAAIVGNSGHQALAVSQRGIVLDEVRPDRVVPLLMRETLVGLINGALLGSLTFVVMLGVTSWRDDPWQLGLVAGAAMMVAMTVGTLSGSGIPLIMRRLGIDPALSSAIIMIMITDAVSFATLLGLASIILPGPA